MRACVCACVIQSVRAGIRVFVLRARVRSHARTHILHTYACIHAGDKGGDNPVVAESL